MQVRPVTTARLRHEVVEAGSGEPLLLIHGYTGAKEDFGDFIDRFADEGWHVVAFDHRGHGESDKPATEDDYSLPILVDDVLALLDALGWESAHVLGHSMGGMVAQVVAVQAPSRVRSLILMDTGHGLVEGVDPDMAAAAFHVARTHGMEHLLELMAGARALPPSAAEQRVRERRPDYEAFGRRKMLALEPAAFASLGALLMATDDRLDSLRGIDVPTLVLVGEEDVPFVGPSERMAAAIPGAVLEVIPEAAHSPQFENPERWWDVVSGFLARQRDGA